MFELQEYQELYAARCAQIDGLINVVPGHDAHTIWLLKRKKGISATDLSVIMGFNRWRTAYELWENKTNLNQIDSITSPAAEWGHRLEDVIAQKYSEVTHSTVGALGTIQDRNYPFLLGSLDRVVFDPKSGKALKVLEIKTTGRNYSSGDTDVMGRPIQSWGPGNQYDENGNCIKADSQVPMEYDIQVQVYMMITGLKEADIAVLIGGQDFRVYTITADQELINTIIQEAERFFCEHILRGVPPQKIEKDLKNVQPEKGTSVQADRFALGAVNQYRELDFKIKAMEKERDALKNTLISLIGTSERLMQGRQCLCSYLMQKGRVLLDAKRLEAEHPEIYQQYLKQSDGFRVFRLSAIK